MRRAASVVMLTLLLVGMLTLAFNIQTAKAYYYYNFTITVIPESPTPQNKVNVTVSLETACINYVVNFSTRSQSGNDFSITIDIYVPQIEQPMIGWAAETYNLGKLLADTYYFNAEVRVWDYTGSLSELLYYGKSFTVAYAITVPDDYPTIQGAINAASDGDTVFVRNGTYYENIVVNKAVSLIGENSVTTIIDGGGFRSPVEVLMDNVTIAGFNIRNSSLAYRFAGVALQSVKFCNVSWNILTGNFDGIYAEYSLNNTFCHNFILGNNWNGVHLKYDCRYNSIASNTILNSRTGISLEASSISNFILFNYIAECEWDGILTYCSSNSIIGNTITNCFTGIYLSEEMNVIYHNNFIGNTYQITCYSAPNVWDNGYPSGGNYWSDYTGTDSNGDGIGDTPYVIDENNQDNFPLMNQYWNPADINHDLKVDIYDVVLACSAYTSTPSDPHWNPHCDIVEPYGIIDIYDIVMIAGSYGESWQP